MDIASPVEPARQNRAVGTECRSMNSFAKDLLASNLEADAVGPIILRPRFSNSSVTPSANDVSPPTKVRSIFPASAKSASLAISSCRIGTHSAISAIPALPLAQNTLETRGLLRKERHIACSLPPDPMTKIFISIFKKTRRCFNMVD
jgi:hypothetical protein